ncbi:MAG: Peptidoglycan D,D-transpeptidase FtsI [Legionellaceae bacterium]
MISYRVKYKSTLPPSDYRWRYRLTYFFLLLAVNGLIYQMIKLTILDRPFLKGQGDALTLRIVDMPAYRGIIMDRHGNPLAISSPVHSIWLNPKEFNILASEVKVIAKLLNISVKEIKQRVEKNKNKEFIYLKRNVSPNIAEKIKALKLEGVHWQQEYHRFYPEGYMTAHLLGFTNIDDKGQEGLELAYNDWLAGIPGKKRVVKDRLGHIVSEVSILRQPKPGQNLILSIDRRIQYMAYRELEKGFERYKADSGSVIVLDIQTGEVLAMVNLPSFNPNSRMGENVSHYRNRAITDVFEPGSTIKTFSMVSALASGKYTLDSMIDTKPGWIIVDGKKVRDEHFSGIIDMATILKRSSNVGMAKITLSLPPSHLVNVLRQVGFGQSTNSGFPGESSGMLIEPNPKRLFSLATLSFGYGMTSTLLQLAQAYNVLANKGIKKPISLFKLSHTPTGEQVISPKVAQAVMSMLETVLEKGGTAPLARVEGFRVAGKTGTARLVGNTGYIKNRHNATFLGIAPVSNPKLLVAVYLHDLPGLAGMEYFGGYTAGPIFSKIMGNSLRLLNISPDDLKDSVNEKKSIEIKEIRDEDN